MIDIMLDATYEEVSPSVIVKLCVTPSCIVVNITLSPTDTYIIIKITTVFCRRSINCCYECDIKKICAACL